VGWVEDVKNESTVGEYLNLRLLLLSNELITKVDFERVGSCSRNLNSELGWWRMRAIHLSVWFSMSCFAVGMLAKAKRR
jgi:hypothetical protein